MDYDFVVKDFAVRTRHNLDVIRELKSEDQYEVYEVTQLINSMLGLLVFPREEYIRRIPAISLTNLQKQGWIVPQVIGGFHQAHDLKTLIRYLRNAIAHFNLEFISDSSNQIVGITLWNEAVDDRPNWKVKMTLTELESLTEQFLTLILDGNTNGANLSFKERASRH